MDYELLKAEVAEISKIAKSVPEQFQERCFEILLESLLAGQAGGPRAANAGQPSGNGGGQPAGGGGSGGGGGDVSIPLQAQMRVFMAKTDVTAEQLGRVIMMDGQQVHFVKEPTSKSVAAGQVDWSLLLALKNGIENNKLEADPEAVRSMCQDKGFYDRKNFASHFKREKTATYFKGPMEPQGNPQGLTSDGLDALGSLVKTLAGAE